MPTYTFNPTDSAASIHATISGAAAGSEFVFNAGTYRGLSITPKAGDMYRAADGAKAILNGGQILTDWTLHSGNVYKVNYSRTLIKREVVNSYTVGSETGYERAGWNITVYADDLPLRSMNTLTGLSAGQFYDDDVNGVVYLGENPATYTTLEVCHTEKAFIISAANVTLQNLVIEKYAAPIQEAAVYTINTTTGHHLTLENVTLHLNYSVGVRLGDDAVMRGCRLLTNAQAGYTGQGVNIQIIGCEIGENNYARVNRSFEGTGGKLSRVTNPVIRGNLYRANYGKGCWLDIDCVNPLVERNLIRDHPNAGIYCEISFDAIIRYNTLVDNCLGRTNQPYDCQLAVVNSQAKDQPYLEIYGNTVVVGSGTNVGGGIGVTQSNRGTSTAFPSIEYLSKRVRVYDNDIYHRGANGRSGFAADYLATAFYSTHDNLFFANCYHRPADNANWQYNGSNIALTAWRNNGQDTAAAGSSDDTTAASGEYLWTTLGLPPYQDRVRGLPLLLRHYPLSDASGTTARDRSPYAQNATYANVSLGQTGIGDGESATRFIPANNSSMDGYNADFNTRFNREKFTVALWAKVASTGVWTNGLNQTLLRIGNTMGAGKFVCHLYKSSTNNRLVYQVDNNGVGFSQAYDGVNWTDWFHLALSVDRAADTAKLYFNGVVIFTRTGLGSGGGTDIASRVRIGSSDATVDHFDGFLADVAVYNTALSDAQILNLYQFNQPPALTAPTLLPYYEGETVNLPTTYAEPNTGQTLSWSLLGAPAWLGVSSVGVLSGVIPSDGAGTSYVAIKVQDNGTPLQMTLLPLTLVVLGDGVTSRSYGDEFGRQRTRSHLRQNYLAPDRDIVGIQGRSRSRRRRY